MTSRRLLVPAVLAASLVLALGAALWAVAALISRDRVALVEAHRKDRAVQLDGAVRSVANALTDVTGDVRFASELLAGGGAPRAHRAELQALLSAVGKYKALSVHAADGSLLLSLTDPRAQQETLSEASRQALERTALAALSKPPGSVAVSAAIDSDTSGWVRVFAAPFRDAQDGSGGAVAVLVDVGPLLEPLKSLQREGQTSLLVLGAHGRPLPLSTPALAARATGASPPQEGLSAVLAALREGRTSTQLLSSEEAAALGLPDAEAVGAAMPIPVLGSQAWAVATVSSTDTLRARDRELVTRLLVVATVLAVIFGALGVTLAIAARRQRELKQTRELAGRLERDLATIRDLEDKLVRAEKLSTVGALAAGIAHEIGTPLGVVRGRAEYLADKLGEDHALAASTRVIVDETDRVSRTIRQLLDFSRVQQPSTHPVEVAQTVDAVATLMGLEAGRRNLTLATRARSGVFVKADGDQLQQVLVNLVMNGFDASTPGGTVTVSVEPAGPDGKVCLSVRDAGAGITDADLPKVFDPFWTTKKRGQGTGLGLAMVAWIVRNHGGEIAIDSAPGQGTTVQVQWPAATVAPDEETHGTQAPVVGGR